MLPPSSRYDKMEAAGSSETSTNSYQSTCRHMLEDGILFSHCLENLRTQTVLYFLVWMGVLFFLWYAEVRHTSSFV